jgi:hypothetical protein
MTFYINVKGLSLTMYLFLNGVIVDDSFHFDAVLMVDFSNLMSTGCSKGAPIFKKPPVSDIAFVVCSLFLNVTNP